MTYAGSTASTPWRGGPFRGRQRGLIFGSMYEDAGIELQAFAPDSRVFSIAAAGDTARALAAASHRVTAVDINPEQLAYAQARAAGHPAKTGSVERLMSHGRSAAALCGWTRASLVSFLALSTKAEQLDYWDRRLDTRRWRAMLDVLLSPGVLGLSYSRTFLQALPRDFGKQIRDRLRRGWAQHANKDNPYAAALLLGAPPVEHGAPQSPIHFACADAAEYLEGCPAECFDAFTLSNIEDGAPPGYLLRLQAAIQRTAKPGAIVVTRTFAEPRGQAKERPGEDVAALDRSLLWGQVRIDHVGGGQPCSIF